MHFLFTDSVRRTRNPRQKDWGQKDKDAVIFLPLIFLPFRLPTAKDSSVLHPETLEAYRHMTMGERLQLTLDMMRENAPRMFQGTPEQVDRRFELLRIQNDDRNRRMLTAIARTRHDHG